MQFAIFTNEIGGTVAIRKDRIIATVTDPECESKHARTLIYTCDDHVPHVVTHDASEVISIIHRVEGHHGDEIITEESLQAGIRIAELEAEIKAHEVRNQGWLEIANKYASPRGLQNIKSPADLEDYLDSMNSGRERARLKIAEMEVEIKRWIDAASSWEADFTTQFYNNGITPDALKNVLEAAQRWMEQMQRDCAKLCERAEQAEASMEAAKNDVPVLDKMRVLKTAQDIFFADYKANPDTHYGGLCDAADEIIGRCLSPGKWRPYQYK